MIRPCLYLVFAVILSACAGKATVAPLKPTIKTLAIVPATPPLSFSLINQSAVEIAIPISTIGYAMDRRAKTKIFTEKMLARRTTIAEELTDAVAQSLRKQGYEVVVLDKVRRHPNDPDNIDYETLSYSADAVLHLYFTQIGLFSGRTSSRYVPRVDAQGVVYVRHYPDYLYDEEICYGADATRTGSWAIAADPKFAYPSFEFVLDNLDAVRDAFGTAVLAIGDRMADQIHAAIK